MDPPCRFDESLLSFRAAVGESPSLCTQVQKKSDKTIEPDFDESKVSFCPHLSPIAMPRAARRRPKALQSAGAAHQSTTINNLNMLSELSSLEVFFSTYGFHALAMAIVGHLDYLALVNLKRSSKIFHNFFKSNNLDRLESKRFEEKLSSDWRQHFKRGCKPKLETEYEPGLTVRSMVFVDLNTLAVARDDKVMLFDTNSGDLVATLDHSYYALRNTSQHGRYAPREVLCMQATSAMIVTGLSDHQICCFDLQLRELVHRCQTVGRVEAMKLIGNWLITGHCISTGAPGVIKLWYIDDIRNVSLVWFHVDDLLPIMRLDAIIKGDEQRIRIAFVENTVSFFMANQNFGVIELKVHKEEEAETWLCALQDMHHLMSLPGYNEGYSAVQCNFVNWNRLVVSEEKCRLLILDLDEELRLTLHRVIKAHADWITCGQVMCTFDNKVASVDYMSDTTAILVDIDDNNPDYQRDKKKHKGTGIMEERLKPKDSRLMWNYRWVKKRGLEDRAAVAISPRQVGCFTFRKMIVHDVWTHESI